MVRLFEVLWHGAGELLAGRIVFEVGVMVVKLLVVERVLLADAEILFSDWAGEQSSCTPLLKKRRNRIKVIVIKWNNTVLNHFCVILSL